MILLEFERPRDLWNFKFCTSKLEIFNPEKFHLETLQFVSFKVSWKYFPSFNLSNSNWDFPTRNQL